MVARDGVPELERAVFEAVNGLPDWLYGPAWIPMQSGSIAGGLILAAALGLTSRRVVVGAVAAGAVTTVWLVAKEVKELVGRERPFGAGLDVTVRDDSTGLGYASGHSAVAFALYAVAAPHLRPPWRRAALGLAGFVAMARIYSGAHLPLDVVGGAALGVIIGEAFRAVEAWHAQRRQ
ncbi:MAG TPA: phosphatase PAP2 family protein [Acidimicrobiales bacterium]|nr:phosphatase PAP2 family protein [Acidimicrobiales bacterium]